MTCIWNSHQINNLLQVKNTLKLPKIFDISVTDISYFCLWCIITIMVNFIFCMIYQKQETHDGHFKTPKTVFNLIYLMNNFSNMSWRLKLCFPRSRYDETDNRDQPRFEPERHRERLGHARFFGQDTDLDEAERPRPAPDMRRLLLNNVNSNRSTNRNLDTKPAVIRAMWKRGTKKNLLLI